MAVPMERICCVDCARRMSSLNRRLATNLLRLPRHFRSQFAQRWLDDLKAETACKHGFESSSAEIPDAPKINRRSKAS
jgi:hypothetical protein